MANLKRRLNCQSCLNEFIIECTKDYDGAVEDDIQDNGYWYCPHCSSAESTETVEE
jgi:DNA-directed RNA polymerase subunit RPC12/RpoP